MWKEDAWRPRQGNLRQSHTAERDNECDDAPRRRAAPFDGHDPHGRWPGCCLYGAATSPRREDHHRSGARDCAESPSRPNHGRRARTRGWRERISLHVQRRYRFGRSRTRRGRRNGPSAREQSRLKRVRSVGHGLPGASGVSLTNGAIMYEGAKTALSKVPEVTLGFWIIKILATTIGETGGDAVTMSLFHADKDANNGGYLIGTCLFMALFIAAVLIQITMKRFHPLIYWSTIVATTTVGTAMADFADRSLGIGYLGGSSLLFALLMISLLLWRWSEGTVSVNSVATPRG